MKMEEIGFYSLSDERIKNVSENSQMKRCEMIITEYCNYKCPYCRGLADYIYSDRKIKQLSLDEIKQNIDWWCESKPLENIRFSGGEPTLHKDIVEVINYSKDKGIKRIAISTNGYNDIKLYRKLFEAGCNDFSISLDACCSMDGDKYSGNIIGSWNKVVENIKEISKWTYVTVGIVLTDANIDNVLDIIYFADSLGVSDIRVISSAQYNKSVEELSKLDDDFLNKYPILKYRVNNFKNGLHMRGLNSCDNNRCPLIMDDSVIAGNYRFPCIIYMREGGDPIGMVSDTMRRDRINWSKNHDVLNDSICNKQCLDVCRDYNNKYKLLR